MSDVRSRELATASAATLSRECMLLPDFEYRNREFDAERSAAWRLVKFGLWLGQRRWLCGSCRGIGLCDDNRGTEVVEMLFVFDSL